MIAVASLVGGIFGKGGGNEVGSALTLQAFQQRFGESAGRNAWADFRSKDDPEAPTTVSQKFSYEQTSPFAPKGLALPDPGSVSFPPVSASGSSGATPPVQIPDDGSIGSQLLRNFFAEPAHASNWLLIPARNSSTGHSIGVLGPQVGYYVPQILMEEDLHGPGFDARGATFPGVNLYVQLGHGRDYAWSATTADLRQRRHVRRGALPGRLPLPVQGPVPGDGEARADQQLDAERRSTQTPAGSETLTVYRTVHGIVYARGTVGGKKVAFASARTTYFHEADSAIGFSRSTIPPRSTTRPRSSRRHRRSTSRSTGPTSTRTTSPTTCLAAYPQRATGTSPDFPILGTGELRLAGLRSRHYTMTTVPFAGHPQAIDPTI